MIPEYRVTTPGATHAVADAKSFASRLGPCRICRGALIDGGAYILDDCSLKAPPAVWGKVVVNTFDRHAADCVVAEVNFGGAMVQAVVQAARSAAKLRVPFKEVRASRGKVGSS